MDEQRLDKVLMERKLVTTRVRAEEIITKSGVLVNGKRINKPGKKIPLDAQIELLGEEIPWVSRGALKLVKALETWPLELSNVVAMDVGASTGGFTEVLLQHGVRQVYAIDVGSGQMHPRIAADERVINLEKTHVRELTTARIPEMLDLCVIDVSFISLEKVFPFLHPFLKAGATVIALVKPQFEVGKANLSKGGIVKNKALYPKVLEQIKAAALLNRLEAIQHIPSPILGGDGNEEFLLLLKRIAD